MIGVPEFASTFDAAAYAARAMAVDDRFGDVAKVTADQQRAEDAFRKRAYGAWPLFPDHPAAPALAALARHERGEPVDPSQVRGLAYLGTLLRMHEEDWRGRERELAARLRSPENFLGCLFELETSLALRRAGHATRWLWPTAHDEGDVLVDETVYVECVAPPSGKGISVPHALGAQVAAAAITAMRKARRNLLVEVVVDDVLRPEHVPALRDAVCGAIKDGTTGAVTLPVDGYSATIADLAPSGRVLTDDEIAATARRQAESDQAWGHVENNDEGRPVNPCLVAVKSRSRDAAILGLARAAARKRSQVKPGRVNVVAAKFGLPVPREQATNPAIQARIRDIVVDALRANAAERISGVLCVFDLGVVFPHPTRGILDPETDPTGPELLVIPVRNPTADVPVPEGL